MKKFSEIARMKRVDFLKARRIKKTSLDAWRPIPEADRQKNENLLTKSQLLSIINSLTPLLSDIEQSRFRSLSSQSRDSLMNILQEVRNILSDKIINTNKEE